MLGRAAGDLVADGGYTFVSAIACCFRIQRIAADRSLYFGAGFALFVLTFLVNAAVA